MRIIIEEYPYPRAKLKELLPDFDLPLQDDDTTVKVRYVGYCYSPLLKDNIYFLPKVILDKGTNKVFGEYDPVILLDFEDAYRNKNIDKIHHDFLYGLSIWLYRAVKVFKTDPRNKDSKIVSQRSISYLDGTIHKVDATIVDIIMSLVKFYEDNQDYFMFIIKNLHSGYNKINWRKTISKQQPLIQHNHPIYMNPVNRKKQINFDEELLIIFYSILNYINKTYYEFHCKINCNYELIDGQLFDAYRKHFGKKRLLEIKYKYFSDKAQHLWRLCYAFFDCSARICSSKQLEDFLIAKDFNIIFEAMIDELIGEQVPYGLKEQKDGKILDHIYLYRSLIRPENIYYIGDSKYYKIGDSVKDPSIYKQYTYAKNVIQYNFFFQDKKVCQHLPYRDELTEGYNITPNFFISADIVTPYSYKEERLKKHEYEDEERVNKQFDNRLFDRDTLWLSHYDINFLYILSLYGRNNAPAKHAFRTKVREIFRNEVVSLLNRHYNFYKLIFESRYAMEEFVKKNFKRLLGKLYHYDGKLILAIERNCNDKGQLLNIIDRECDLVKQYKLN